jgi:hypothetical protein
VAAKEKIEPLQSDPDGMWANEVNGAGSLHKTQAAAIEEAANDGQGGELLVKGVNGKDSD